MRRDEAAARASLRFAWRLARHELRSLHRLVRWRLPLAAALILLLLALQEPSFVRRARVPFYQAGVVAVVAALAAAVPLLWLHAQPRDAALRRVLATTQASVISTLCITIYICACALGLGLFAAFLDLVRDRGPAAANVIGLAPLLPLVLLLSAAASALRWAPGSAPMRTLAWVLICAGALAITEPLGPGASARPWVFTLIGVLGCSLFSSAMVSRARPI